MDVQSIRAVTEAVRAEVRKAVVGQDEVIDLLLTSLLVGGHILLEGVPGTAKTLITRAFGAGLALQFGRIQFTPDLMPGDVLGTNLFNFQTNTFILTKGAIWYNESGAKPNTIVRFDPKTEKFQTWAIPGGGDIVRNMDVTPDGNPVTANSLTNQVGLVEIK